MRQEHRSRLAFVTSAFLWGATLAFAPDGRHVFYTPVSVLRAVLFLFT